jgi:ABC-2 type transport system permease protein
MFAATIMSSPRSAMPGNVYNDSVGAVGSGRRCFHTLIRHSRAEEESGRAELIDSTAVGRMPA